MHYYMNCLFIPKVYEKHFFQYLFVYPYLFVKISPGSSILYTTSEYVYRYRYSVYLLTIYKLNIFNVPTRK